MPLDTPDRLARFGSEPRTDRPMGERMHRFVSAVQTRIVRALERVEAEGGGAARFTSDAWAREGGGGGLARVIENGRVFQKGGVNVSAVHGDLPPAAVRSLGFAPDVPEAQAGEAGLPFYATGLSLVVHAVNPHLPTVHANLRYFALGPDPLRPDAQWFGGGADLTPVYARIEDAVHFHRVWRDVCARHPGVADYAAFKAACDRYFYLPHRGEARGVGGVFFDRLGGDDPERAFLFVREAARAFLSSYLPIVEARKDAPFGEAEQAFQRWRRGRYAEFNLAYDRGTRFGLETGGRAESILMSLPPQAEWRYDWTPEPGSPEAAALGFLQPRDWLGEAGGAAL